MTPQSSVNFPKIDLKSPLKVQKHYKKWVLRAVFAVVTCALLLPEADRDHLHQAALPRPAKVCVGLHPVDDDGVIGGHRVLVEVDLCRAVPVDQVITPQICSEKRSRIHKQSAQKRCRNHKYLLGGFLEFIQARIRLLVSTVLTPAAAQRPPWRSGSRSRTPPQ